MSNVDWRLFALWNAVTALSLAPMSLTPVRADDPLPKKKAAAESLDDELLKDLGGTKKPEAPKGDAKPEGDPKEKTAAEGNDAVGELSRRMRQVESIMRRTKHDETLRPQQEQIVSQLEALIAKIEQQQQQQSKSPSSGKPSSQSQSRGQVTQPQKSRQSGSAPSSSPSDSSSELKKQRTEPVDMAKMQETLKDIWGQLPPRLREQMLQSGVERFVPKYELLIEQYFKTLAERQNGEAP